MNQRGYVALLSVLIIGAVALSIALVVLTTGTDAQRSTLITQQSIQAEQLANSCAEEALQLMHDTTSYTGTGSLTLGAGTCSYTVTNTGGTNRTVATSGTVGNVVKRITVYAIIGSSTISTTSWQEVN